MEKLKTRYSATGDNEAFQAGDVEQQEWEEAQMGRSKAQYGSKEAAAKAQAEADKYDYVFDEQISFVRELAAADLSGDSDSDSDGTGAPKPSFLKPAPPRTAAELAQQEHASLQEVRRSLPIFQYRQQLIDAVDAHQVLVIVGETGSGKVTPPVYRHIYAFLFSTLLITFFFFLHFDFLITLDYTSDAISTRSWLH